ncbi:MAG: hypothetical protein IPJ88_12635 [Myxococcales bacterium]|nr:MAG: hypothetical protein IPJ88_12635 [Myxococcales bacterium]
MTLSKMTYSMTVFALGLVLGLGVIQGKGSAEPTPSKKKDKKSSASFTESVACDTCHSTSGWRMKGVASGQSGFDHAKTGFPLTGRHKVVPCLGCHQPGKHIKRDCNSCHHDNHEGRLGRFCDSCHSAVSFSQVRAIEVHRRTRLPLTGMHALLDCTQCHTRTTGREFSTVPSDCFSCHATEYRSPDTHPLHSGTSTQQAFPRNCSLCHRSIAWSPATVDPTIFSGNAAMLLSTQGHDIRFAISYGAHQGSPCESCHLSENNRRLVSCTSCHAHNTLRLKQQHQGKLPSPQAANCLHCHPGGIAR